MIATLVIQACTATRCQSANDLWNMARRDPELDEFKTSLCDATLGDLLAIMTDETQPPAHCGAAALMALGEDAGGAAPCHIGRDPGAIFAAFSEAGRFSHVSAIYEAAFRKSGLALAPLSLCLWSQSRGIGLTGSDDDVPPVTWIGAVPSFALDQYTRAGLTAIRRFAYSSRTWHEFADSRQISRSDWPKAVGELVFRTEGAVVTNRRVWEPGMQLFARSGVLGCFMPEAAVPQGRELIRRELRLLNALRLRPPI